MKDLNSYRSTIYDYKKEILEQQKRISELEEAVLHEKFLYNDMEKHYLEELDHVKKVSLKSKVKNKLKSFIRVNEVKQESIENEIKTESIKIDNKIIPSYNSWYEDNIDYSEYKSDIKPIAFYLPQFHTFKENDKWWGKGFTEWTNTKKSVPRFDGHYQPREPHDDIGYYFLDNEETIKKQVKLAKQHGLYGFAFYYYWFSGKTLMTKPIDLFLKDKKEDFKFCLCWANENWTRRWDGLDKEVLIKQDYTKEDQKNFIKDIKKYLLNNRYITIDGKPLIMVYNPDEIPDYENMVSEWRKTARDLGIGEIYIIQKQCMGNYEDKHTNCVDGEFDFAPTGFGHEACRIDTKITSKAYDYEKLVNDIDGLYNQFYPVKDFYFSSTMGWDNSARRKKDFKVYCNYSPKSFYKWLRYTIRETRRRLPEDKRFIFVNAWNEWAEGTYLEPDKKYGYTNINTLSKAINDIPMNTDNLVTLNKVNKIDTKFNKKIAIQVHVYYLDVFEKITNYLKEFPYEYDLYVSVGDLNKINDIKRILKKIKAKNIKIDVFENKGRDIFPFIKQMSKCYKKYDFILKLHTKKTEEYDNEWCEYLLKNLVGDKYTIASILQYLNENGGVMYPVYYKSILDMIRIGGNQQKVEELLNKMKYDSSIVDLSSIDFPAGTMFYCESNTFKKIFELDNKYMSELFDNSLNDCTYAHALERLFGIVPNLENKKISIYNIK